LNERRAGLWLRRATFLAPPGAVWLSLKLPVRIEAEFGQTGLLIHTNAVPAKATSEN